MTASVELKERLCSYGETAYKNDNIAWQTHPVLSIALKCWVPFTDAVCFQPAVMIKVAIGIKNSFS